MNPPNRFGPIKGYNVVAGSHFGGDVTFNFNSNSSDAWLYVTDPEKDKERIIKEKEPVLKDCFSWILCEDFYRQWRAGNSRLLWIKGDAGKGKTMMTIGIINEIYKPRSANDSNAKVDNFDDKSLNDTPIDGDPLRQGNTSDNCAKELISFFFCQESEPNLRSSVSVCRGLIFLLIKQRPALKKYLEEFKDLPMEDILQGPNAFSYMEPLLTNIAQDPEISTIIVVVDALDECTDDRAADLVAFIDKDIMRESKLRWLITSRNDDSINKLSGLSSSLDIILEENQDKVNSALNVYIDYKVEQLVTQKRLGHFKNKLLTDFRNKSENSFLWVSLVCKELIETDRTIAETILNELPRGLKKLFCRMIKRIQKNHHPATVGYCMQLLSTLAVAIRPLRLAEVVTIVGLPAEFRELSDVSSLVSSCGSLLIIEQNREVKFVHKSAKDFVLGSKELQDLSLPSLSHKRFSRRLLDSMIDSIMGLKMDICDMKEYGPLSAGLDESWLDSSRLGPINYACCHWIEHLVAEDDTVDSAAEAISDHVLEFCKASFLYWIEAMGLLRRASAIPRLLQCLERWSQCQSNPELIDFISDARKFVGNFLSIIREAPLQVYGMVIGLSPGNSKIKQYFGSQMLPHIITASGTEADWSSLLMTFSNDTRSNVDDAAYSPDGNTIAVSTSDGIVRIWEVDNGNLKREIFIPYKAKTLRLMFSHQGHLLAASCRNELGKFGDFYVLWRTANGSLVHLLQTTAYEHIRHMAFSPNDEIWANVLDNKFIQLWDTQISGSAIPKIRIGWPQSDIPSKLQFLKNGAILAAYLVCSGTLRCWSTETGCSLPHRSPKPLGTDIIVLSPDGILVRSASSLSGSTVEIWDWETQTYFPNIVLEQPVREAIIVDEKSIACRETTSLSLWKFRTGQCCWKIKIFPEILFDISHDGKFLAIISYFFLQSAIEVYDVGKGQKLQRLVTGSDTVSSIRFSPKTMTLASCHHKEVKTWKITPSGDVVNEVYADLRMLKFAPNFETLISMHAIVDDSVQTPSAWCTQTEITLWSCPTVLYRDKFIVSSVSDVAFSLDSKFLAVATIDGYINIKDMTGNAGVLKLYHKQEPVKNIRFSKDQLVSLSCLQMRIWDSTIWPYKPKLSYTPVNLGGDLESLCISQDGIYLGVAGSRHIDIWNLDQNQKLYTIESLNDDLIVNEQYVERMLDNMLFTPNGLRFVHVCSKDIWPKSMAYICLRGTLNGQLLSNIQVELQFGTTINKMRFSSDGNYLLLIRESRLSASESKLLALKSSDEKQEQCQLEAVVSPDLEGIVAREKWVKIEADGWVKIGNKFATQLPLGFLASSYHVTMDDSSCFLAVWYPRFRLPTIIHFDPSKL